MPKLLVKTLLLIFLFQSTISIRLVVTYEPLEPVVPSTVPVVRDEKGRRSEGVEHPDPNAPVENTERKNVPNVVAPDEEVFPLDGTPDDLIMKNKEPEIRIRNIRFKKGRTIKSAKVCYNKLGMGNSALTKSIEVVCTTVDAPNIEAVDYYYPENDEIGNKLIVAGKSDSVVMTSSEEQNIGIAEVIFRYKVITDDLDGFIALRLPLDPYNRALQKCILWYNGNRTEINLQRAKEQGYKILSAKKWDHSSTEHRGKVRNGLDDLLLEIIENNENYDYPTLIFNTNFKVKAMSRTMIIQQLVDDIFPIHHTPKESYFSDANFTGRDVFKENIFLAHHIFISATQIIQEISTQYPIPVVNGIVNGILTSTEVVRVRKLVLFVHSWVTTTNDTAFEASGIDDFLLNLHVLVQSFNSNANFGAELALMDQVKELQTIYRSRIRDLKPEFPELPEQKEFRRMIPSDKSGMIIYISENRSITLPEFPLSTPAWEVRNMIAEQLEIQPTSQCKENPPVLFGEVDSDGTKMCEIKRGDVGLQRAASNPNARIFFSPREENVKTRFTPATPVLPTPHVRVTDLSTELVAYHLTLYDLKLLECLHEEDLLYPSMDKVKTGLPTNRNAIIKRFNEIACWVRTEICGTEDLEQTEAVINWFIDLGEMCRKYKNFNTTYSIISALQSAEVSRLDKAWKRLSAKLNLLMAKSGMELNYKLYREEIRKADPPFVVFQGVLAKDLEFLNQNAAETEDGLIYLFRINMAAAVMRTVRRGKRSDTISKKSLLEPNNKSTTQEISTYIRCLRCYDGDKFNYNNSLKLEPRPKAEQAEEEQSKSNSRTIRKQTSLLDLLSRKISFRASHDDEKDIKPTSPRSPITSPRKLGSRSTSGRPLVERSATLAVLPGVGANKLSRMSSRHSVTNQKDLLPPKK